MDYESAPNGRGDFDRRAFIRRAGVVSAATVWAAPTVQSLVAPAFATGTPAGPCDARLTGGGRIDGGTLGTAALTFVTYGLGQINCDGSGPVQIQINAHGPRGLNEAWHFDENLQITCSHNGNPAPPPNTATCPNTFSGTVEDGEGNTLTFTFVDNGEPGGHDEVTLQTAGPKGVLLVSGTRDGGNLQAHGQPGGRECLC